MPSSESITEAQLSSLDATDCYASVWQEILAKQLQEESKIAANLWGGRGKGGRGLARRTIQPKDVVLENVHMQYIHGDVILDGATIKLLNNHVYSLVGKNGCGKSTLLSRMHSQKIPGWSTQWTSLYIPPSLPTEYTHLTPLQVVKKFFERCRNESRTAVESRIKEVEDEIDILVEEEQEKMELLCEEISHLEDASNLDQDYLERSNISELLQELDIDPHHACGDLSSCKQKEVLLLVASICCSFTNLLLLDEPTSNLDIAGLLRLRRLIEQSTATIVMVSHDVDLINDVSTDIIDMQAKKLWYYPGNYDSYRLMKEQKEKHNLKQSMVMEKKREQLRSTLQHLKERPTSKRKGGSKKKAKAIASHRKKMEWHDQTMKTLDSSAILPERAGLTAIQRLKLAEIMKNNPDKAVQFALPATSSQWGEPLIVAYDVGYGTDKEAVTKQKNATPEFIEDGEELKILKRDGFLFDCVDICIEEGSRNCILGPSDVTSFLLRILAKKLAPVEGMVQHAAGLSVGYFDLEIVNTLVSTCGPNTTALGFLSQHYPSRTEEEIRAHLTGFGLSATVQGKTPICFLSGGETFRFVLAKIMMDNPSILFLEHPTASLDVESVQALSHGLGQWNGTLVMTSIDANFLRSLEDVKCFVIVPEEGKLRRIVSGEGMQGMDAYLKTLH